MSSQVQSDVSLGTFDTDISRILWRAYGDMDRDYDEAEKAQNANGSNDNMVLNSPTLSCSSLFERPDKEALTSELQTYATDVDDTAIEHHTFTTSVDAATIEHQTFATSVDAATIKHQTFTTEVNAAITKQQACTGEPTCTIVQKATSQDPSQDLLQYVQDMPITMGEEFDLDFDAAIAEAFRAFDENVLTDDQAVKTTFVDTQPAEGHHGSQIAFSEPVEDHGSQITLSESVEVHESQINFQEPVEGHRGSQNSQNSVADLQHGIELAVDKGSYGRPCVVPDNLSEHGLAGLIGITLEQANAGVRNKKARVRNTMIEKLRPATKRNTVKYSGVKKSKPVKAKLAVSNLNVQFHGEQKRRDPTVPVAHKKRVGKSQLGALTPVSSKAAVNSSEQKAIAADKSLAWDYYLGVFEQKLAKMSKQGARQMVFPYQQQASQNAAYQQVQQQTLDSYLALLQRRQAAARSMPQQATQAFPNNSLTQGQLALAHNPQQHTALMTPRHSPMHGGQSATYSSPNQVLQMGANHHPMNGGHSGDYNTPNPGSQMFTHPSPMNGAHSGAYNTPNPGSQVFTYPSPMSGGNSGVHITPNPGSQMFTYPLSMNGGNPGVHNTPNPGSQMFTYPPTMNGAHSATYSTPNQAFQVVAYPPHVNQTNQIGAYNLSQPGPQMGSYQLNPHQHAQNGSQNGIHYPSQVSQQQVQVQQQVQGQQQLQPQPYYPPILQQQIGHYHGPPQQPVGNLTQPGALYQAQVQNPALSLQNALDADVLPEDPFGEDFFGDEDIVLEDSQQALGENAFDFNSGAAPEDYTF